MAQRKTPIEDRRKQNALIHDVAELLWAQINLQKATKAEIARALGTSRPAVSMALSGEHNLTLRTLWDLAHAVGCRVRIDLVQEVTDIPLQRKTEGEVARAEDRQFVVAA